MLPSDLPSDRLTVLCICHVWQSRAGEREVSHVEDETMASRPVLADCRNFHMFSPSLLRLKCQKHYVKVTRKQCSFSWKKFTRNSNRSSSISGRGAAWLAWEEERRSLEETISELNMRLAGRDHDIAELRMQIEERERDLRFMYGRVCERKSWFCLRFTSRRWRQGVHPR